MLPKLPTASVDLGGCEGSPQFHPRKRLVTTPGSEEVFLKPTMQKIGSPRSTVTGMTKYCRCPHIGLACSDETIDQ